jgi:hypothetical protein
MALQRRPAGEAVACHRIALDVAHAALVRALLSSRQLRVIRVIERP